MGRDLSAVKCGVNYRNIYSPSEAVIYYKMQFPGYVSCYFYDKNSKID